MSESVRCVECGYLCGLALGGMTGEERNFDPRLLRTSPDYDENLLSELAFTKHRLEKDPQNRVVPYAQPEQYTWAFCNYIRCHRGQFQSIELHRDTGPRRGAVSDNQKEQVRRGIWQERECNCFFPYHAGLSAGQHWELQTEERQQKRNQDFQLVLGQETKRMQEAQVRLQRWALTIALVGILLPVVSGVVTSVFIPRWLPDSRTVILVTETPVSTVVPMPTPTASP